MHQHLLDGSGFSPENVNEKCTFMVTNPSEGRKAFWADEPAGPI
jgi:hypothetical protein